MEIDLNRDEYRVAGRARLITISRKPFMTAVTVCGVWAAFLLYFKDTIADYLPWWGDLAVIASGAMPILIVMYLAMSIFEPKDEKD